MWLSTGWLGRDWREWSGAKCRVGALHSRAAHAERLR
ncbi:hypothetical protein SMACR_12869 [Sordaria macrospora]|uniref:Uncharacterized protein n=1 Tax=Sordaria macrospora TaxID=5147 RepID=A0A8S8ZIT3_SORMA|nr:hypothetical protein SMACR_12869 [Sordaria macrospora]